MTPLAATQEKIDGFFGQLPYKCHQNRVASVGDAQGRDTRQEDVESLSTLRPEGSPAQSRISPGKQRILRKLTRDLPADSGRSGGGDGGGGGREG